MERNNNLKVCRFPDKEFIINSFSKSGQSVYFEDKRTNKKCNCSIYKVDHNQSGIHKYKIAYERDRKIKQILKWSYI